MYDFGNCRLCPRNCGADRINGVGFCCLGEGMRIARASLHMWEEPCISGSRGSGAVFFVGCNLGCSYCQNSDISRCKDGGREVDGERFREILFSLKNRGCHNINLVTPTHLAPQIKQAILPIKKELGIPVVCNTGGYDGKTAVEYMTAFTDVFLPDFKYGLEEDAKQLSFAADYPEVALESIRKMVEHTGKPVFSPDGILLSGTLVRHLVLPGRRKNSLAVMDLLGNNFGADEILVSVMRQYTPRENAEGAMARRVTTFEYQSVAERCCQYGFNGYLQDSESANSGYTPAFDLTGV